MLTGGKVENNNKQQLAKISVIIVTYNAAKTLQSCLNSIYIQKYPNIEIVIIDGGSTDGTIKILENNSDNIYYWKSEKDNGIYDAMNKGLTHITGDWVYFIGADDVMRDDFSALAYELEQPDAIYYGSVWCKNKKFNGEVTNYSIAKYGVYHQAIIYPRSVFEKFTYDTKYVVRADHVLNIKSVAAGIPFIFKDYILADFSHLGVSNNYVDGPFEKDQVSLVYNNFSFGIFLRFLFWRFKKNYIRKKR